MSKQGEGNFLGMGAGWKHRIFYLAGNVLAWKDHNEEDAMPINKMRLNKAIIGYNFDAYELWLQPLLPGKEKQDPTDRVFHLKCDSLILYSHQATKLSPFKCTCDMRLATRLLTTAQRTLPPSHCC